MKDLTEGILMPEEKVEGVELIRVELSLRNLLDCSVVPSNYLVDTQ